MTSVTRNVLISTVYEWRVPVYYDRGTVVGEIHTAIGMAETKLVELTGNPKAIESDNWLRVRSDDEAIVFWFELREPRGDTE